MRDIKFRIFDKATNAMLDQGDNWRFYLNGGVSIESTWSTKDCIVMQYTGLKDRNGVEIYEGDLVEVRGIRLCKVIFHKEAGCWDLNLLSCKSSLPIGAVSPASWVYHAEVVGNTHENQELAASYGA